METKPKHLPFPWLFRWKLWRNVLLALAGLVTVYALFCAEENFRGKRAWETYKSEMEAKGEILDFTKFVPAPVPDDQNFAMTPFLAQLFDFFPGTQKTRDSNAWQHVYKVTEILPGDVHEVLDGTKWQTAKPLDLIDLANKLLVTNRHKLESSPLNSEQTQEAEQTIINKLQPVTEVIEELRKASTRPYSRFNIDYDWEPKFDIILPHLATVKSACLILELRSCTELRSGDTDAAFQDVNLMFHLVQSLRTEPIHISQLVRAACLGETLQPIWEGLEKRHWSDKQLAEFTEELSALELMKDGIQCLHAEQCFSDTFFARLRRTWNPMEEFNNTVVNFNNQQGPDAPAYILGALAPSGWYYLEQLNYHRLLAYETTDVMKTDRIDPSVVDQRKAEIAGKSYSSSSALWHHRIIAQFLLRAFDNGIFDNGEFKMTRAQTWANLAIIACALQRYRLAHNEYPENLAALAPKYLSSIPNDLIMGQPLKYRRSDDGKFIIYSVGWNEKDDGGVAAKDNHDMYLKEGPGKSEGDWVWKYPGQVSSK